MATVRAYKIIYKTKSRVNCEFWCFKLALITVFIVTVRLFKGCMHAYKENVLTETDIVAFVTVMSQRNNESCVLVSRGIIRPYLRRILGMLWSPKTLGAEAQLGPGGTHLTARAPRRPHTDPAIPQSVITSSN